MPIIPQKNNTFLLAPTIRLLDYPLAMGKPEVLRVLKKAFPHLASELKDIGGLSVCIPVNLSDSITLAMQRVLKKVYDEKPRPVWRRKRTEEQGRIYHVLRGKYYTMSNGNLYPVPEEDVRLFVPVLDRDAFYATLS